jgi:hypothetical protein
MSDVAYSESEQERVTALTTAHGGTIPPPFWAIKNVLPMSICWRMGGGEDYSHLWWKWWSLQRFTEEEKIAFFRQWPPPHAWLEWMVEAVWGDLPVFSVERTAAAAPFFERTAALGFGSKKDYETDLDDPKWEEHYD